MSDLRLDTTTFERAARQLGEVAGVLEGGSDPTGRAADAVGDTGLTGALLDVADGSTRRRRLLAADARTLADGLTSTARSFDEVEQGLASAVSGQGA